MASKLRRKTALKASLFSFFAGVHTLMKSIEINQAIQQRKWDFIKRDYKAIHQSPLAMQQLADYLSEEGLYPFGEEWPGDALIQLGGLLKLPKLKESTSSGSMKFKFKKGFHEILRVYGEEALCPVNFQNSGDHWLLLILNASFHAAPFIAAQYSEHPKLYYQAFEDIEAVEEPWNGFSQINQLLDRQIQRENFYSRATFNN